MAKELANIYIQGNEFKTFKDVAIQASKVLNNMLNDKEYLKRTYNGKIVELKTNDNGIISQSNIVNFSSSYLAPTLPGEFYRVKILCYFYI